MAEPDGHLAASACDNYRRWVRGNSDFVTYFRQATRNPSVASSSSGSRPAPPTTARRHRNTTRHPPDLCLEPEQTDASRLAGRRNALSDTAATTEGLSQLRDMQQNWPFFASRLSMLDMVYAKSSTVINQLYDTTLVDEDLQPLGKELRDHLIKDIGTLQRILNVDTLLADDPWGLESIGLRQQLHRAAQFAANRTATAHQSRGRRKR